MTRSEPGIDASLKALALLLSYPDTTLQAYAPELAGMLEHRPEMESDDRAAVREFTGWLGREDLMEIQAAYVETFDRSKKVSLYLFEHVYGESRDRGPAMIELASAYREHGLEIDCKELPDFLPMFLEFVAQLPETQAREWLTEVGHILQQVHVRLLERESRFATPFRALLRIARIDPEPELMAQQASEEPRDDTPAALDRGWMEAPVTFGADEPRTNCGATRQAPVEQPVQWMDYRDRAGSGRG